MKQFLDTICIRDAKPQHLEWHQRRVDSTMEHFYPAHHHSWKLENCIDAPSGFRQGIVRCRIQYDAHHLSVHYFAYTPVTVRKLKLVENPAGFDYRYKFADRTILDQIFEGRGDADDILITDQGWVRDTSIANIAFSKSGRWYTPSFPLLAGTTWKRLIHEGVIIPRPIHTTEIKDFDSFRIFNALNSFNEAAEIPVSHIK